MVSRTIFAHKNDKDNDNNTNCFNIGQNAFIIFYYEHAYKEKFWQNRPINL